MATVMKTQFWSNDTEIILLDAKRVLVGAGVHFLFYSTLLYNVIRNRIQAEFRWWDEVDQEVIEIEAKALRVGKSIGVVHVEVRKNETGKLVAQSRLTKYLTAPSKL